jgi:ribonucleotide monophosphatase NagD (HAD superfamily)
MTTLRFVERLRDLIAGVDVVLSDIWGVVHNGLVAFRKPARRFMLFASEAAA